MTNLFSFLRSESKYLLLCALSVTVYFLFFHQSAGEHRPSSAHGEYAGHSAFQAAEEKLKERVEDASYWTRVIEEKPWLGAVVAVGALLLMVTLVVGIGIDIFWLVSFLKQKTLIPQLDPVAGPPWRLTDIFRVSVLFMSMSIVLGIFLHFAIYFFFDYMHDNLLVLIHTMLTDMGVIVCVLYFLRSMYGTGVGGLGLDFRDGRRSIGLGLMAYCAILPLFLVLLIALVAGAHWIGYEPPPHPLVEVLVEEEAAGAAVVSFSLFLACVLGPMVEEIFFRGFCYPVLKRRWGVFWATVISSAVFAAIHNSGFAFIPVFVLGVVLAYLYECRGTLVPSITLHVVHNTLFLGYFFVLKSLFLGE